MAQVVDKDVRTFNVKSRRALVNKAGKVTLIAREHYLRQDISCFSMACPSCVAKSADVHLAYTPILSEDATHYLIPSIAASMRYIELFERPDLSNIIFSQTLISYLRDNEPRLTKRVRAVSKESRRTSIVFCNDTLNETFVPFVNLHSDESESVQARNNAALLKMTQWWQKHLREANVSIQPVLVCTEEESLLAEAKSAQVAAFSMEQYLANFHERNFELRGLADSIHHSYLESLKPSSALDFGTPTQYEDYKPTEVLDAEIKGGRLLRGKFRNIPGKQHVVSVPGRPEIVIPNLICCNRALQNDIVAVQILGQQGSFDTGKIVGILKRDTEKVFACTISAEDAKSTSGFIMAVPYDYYIPKIRFRTNNAADLASKYFTVKIDRWDLQSNYPTGHFVKVLGPVDDHDTKMKVVIEENGFNFTPYSQRVISTLPTTDWKPTAEELNGRLDCRDWIVFSIDPKGCQDIDDALSCRLSPTGNLQIGVHIADVSHFVRAETELDQEACRRGTSVYLPDRRIDMIPGILAEQVCSLREKKDRFTMSVVWEFDSSLNVIGQPQIARSVIRSRHEMTYEEAEAILEKTAEAKKKYADFSELLPCLEGLQRVARHWKKQCLDDGLLEFNSVESRFQLDDQKQPIGVLHKRQREIHGMVAIYMIYANMEVAKFLYRAMPKQALLRQHPHPNLELLQELVAMANLKGLKIDTQSSKHLATSLRKVSETLQDADFDTCLSQLVVKAMAAAAYICTGNIKSETELRHFGLAIDYYTHFTSPIRRYADLLVHRQIGHVLDGKEFRADVSEIVENLNEQTKRAKNIQRNASELYHLLYYAKFPQPAAGIVLELREDRIKVCLPTTGLTQTILLKDEAGKFLVPAEIFESRLKTTNLVLQSIQLNPERTCLTFHLNHGTVSLYMMDHVQVLPHIEKENVRYPKLNMQLASLTASTPSKSIPVQKIELEDVEETQSKKSVKRVDAFYQLVLATRNPLQEVSSQFINLIENVPKLLPERKPVGRRMAHTIKMKEHYALVKEEQYDDDYSALEDEEEPPMPVEEKYKSTIREAEKQAKAMAAKPVKFFKKKK